MTEPTTGPPSRSARKWLLTQNSQLRAEGIFNWPLPAFAGRLDDGRTYNTCPEAGACAPLCYARVGSYRFRNVLAAHQRNLKMILDDLPGWAQQMTTELQHKRYQGKWVRLHDSGDFFSDAYLLAWLDIMRTSPHVRFYCYTKAISRFRRLVETAAPDNFLWCYSLGGKEDHLLDLETERHAEVFPSTTELQEAGYFDQTPSDLLAVLGPKKVGIPANRIPHLIKRLGAESFGSLQRALDDRLAEKQKRAKARAFKLAS
ncbi:GP88 family protein [Streptosporangium roseum]|uniref:GP88 family protein n=1 Tax=Streptosporangium roseum TaxID=2001 RepID=UPI00331B3718